MFKKWYSIILYLLILTIHIAAQDASPGTSGLGDPYFPYLGNGGYDVHHYILEFDVDMGNNFITGTTTIEAIATQNLSAFNLDFSGLDIEAITVNGESAIFSRENTELTITPVKNINNDERFTTVISYSGIPQIIEHPYGLRGWRVFEEGVFTHNEPDAAMTWYPNNNHPLDKATYTFRITVEKPYAVAANGLLQEIIDDGATQTFIWEASDPMASYVVAVNIARYRLDETERADGLPIINFLPPTSNDAISEILSQNQEMIEFLSGIFGAYPFESYGVVIAPDEYEWGMEHQTRITLPKTAIVYEIVLIHELAHQWVGNSVSLASWQDNWLKEGMATYTTYLWLEHQNKITDSSLWLYTYLINDIYLTGDPTLDGLFDTGSVYARGGLTIHALRRLVGDGTFFNILRTYIERYTNSNASTADFIAVAEELSGQDLTAFFDAWLYSTEIPPIPD